MLNKKARANISKRLEQLFNFLFSFFRGNIFNINIVDHSPLRFQYIFWFNSINIKIFKLKIQSSFSRFWIFITNKTIISFRVIFINCNFGANNLSKLWKYIKDLLIVNILVFWKLDKKIFIVKFSSFHNFTIEWQCSTRFSFNFKISHFIAS